MSILDNIKEGGKMNIQDKVETDLNLWAGKKNLGVLTNNDSPNSGNMYFQHDYNTVAKIVFNYQVGSSRFVITLVGTKEIKEMNIQNEDGQAWADFWSFIRRNIK